MKKSERLFHIVNLLRNNQKLKAEDLADECEVTPRQIYRDINDLSALSVPVYFESDGYKLSSNTFMPSLNFTFDEILALKIGLSHPALRSIGILQDSIKMANAKINNSIGKEIKNEMDKVGSKIKGYSDSPNVKQINSSVFSALEKGISKQIKVQIEYESLKKHMTKRIVDPYRMSYYQDSWYLIGFCNNRNEVRIFKLSRIIKASVTDKEFIIPGCFSIEDFLKDSWKMYKGRQKEKIKILFSSSVSKLIRETLYHPTQKVKEQRDGSVVFEVEISAIEEIMRWILSFGENAKVLEPSVLKDKIKQTAGKILKMY